MIRTTMAAAFLLCATAVHAQPAVPQIAFEGDVDFLKLPKDMYLGEVSGVTTNRQGHIFVFNRGNTRGPAYAAAAAQLLEFGPDGHFIREIGKNLYAWSFAHDVKIDHQGNIWAADKGSDQVIRFNPDGRVTMVFGRKQEASDEGTEPLKHPKPPLPPIDGMFRQVTDITWDSKGNGYISDGYINSRVAKISPTGEWLGSFGTPGDGPGQLNTPHSIAIDAEDHIYVADRGNRRIQVFDTDGKVLRQITAAGHREDDGGRVAMDRVHHPAAAPGAVHLGRVPGPDLQAVAGRQGAGRAWRKRQAGQAVRLDPRTRLPVGEHAVCGGAAELASPEADAAPVTPVPNHIKRNQCSL
jgi:DNA-binding beta-propeller fold protein YncE